MADFGSLLIKHVYGSSSKSTSVKWLFNYSKLLLFELTSEYDEKNGFKHMVFRTGLYLTSWYYYWLLVYRSDMQHDIAQSTLNSKVNFGQTRISRETKNRISPYRAIYGCLPWVISIKHTAIYRTRTVNTSQYITHFTVVLVFTLCAVMNKRFAIRQYHRLGT